MSTLTEQLRKAIDALHDHKVRTNDVMLSPNWSNPSLREIFIALRTLDVMSTSEDGTKTDQDIKRLCGHINRLGARIDKLVTPGDHDRLLTYVNERMGNLQDRITAVEDHADKLERLNPIAEPPKTNEHMFQACPSSSPDMRTVHIPTANGSALTIRAWMMADELQKLGYGIIRPTQ